MVRREKLKKGRDHLTESGEFQSDKYEGCPAGFLPLKISDSSAWPELISYAHKRGAIDPEFERDLLEAVKIQKDIKEKEKGGKKKNHFILFLLKIPCKFIKLVGKFCETIGLMARRG